MTGLILTQLRVAFGLSKLMHGKRRWRTLGLVALVAVCVAPSYAGYVAMLHHSYKALAVLGPSMQDLVLTSSYSTVQLTVLLVGIPVVFATLFQSRDLSILLPLPLRPYQIVCAKLVTVYTIELVVGAAMFAPALVLHQLMADGSPASAANAVLALIALPVIPMALSTIASLVVSSVPFIGTNRWFWYIAMTLALLGASLSYTMISSAGVSMTAADLAQARTQQIEMSGRILPGAVLALKAMTSQGVAAWGYQGLSALAGLGNIALTLLVGQWLYVGPVVRGTAAARRAGRRAERAQVRGFVASYMRKEVATTLKDPAVAMNGLGGYIALPLLAVTYTIIKWQTRGKVDIMGQMLAALGTADIGRYMPYVAVGVAIGLAAFSAMSSLFSASYSKDGKRLWIEKTLPVSPFDVMVAKLMLGVTVVSIFNVATLILVELVVPLTAAAWFYALLVSELLVVACGAVGLAIDCLRPKLVWKDTVQAVKQNLNVVLAMGLSSALLGANVGLLVLMFRADASPAAVYGAILALNVAITAGSLAFARATSRALERVVV